MAVPSSGELELYGDIGTELGVAQSNVTLHGMSQTAGFTPPDATSEFYGYDPTPPVPTSFNTVLYTGNSTNDFSTALTQSITGVGFEPDLVWIKNRNSDYVHGLFDIVRGAPKILIPNLTAAEFQGDGYLKSFDSDGFGLGGDYAFNRNDYTYVAWCWKAAGYANTFNVLENGVTTTGSTAASVGISTSGANMTLTGASVNKDAGFSITTNTGGSSYPEWVSHGLGVIPDLVMTKQRNNAEAWLVNIGPGVIDSSNWNLNLNTTLAAGVDGRQMTSTVVPLTYGPQTQSFVSYAFKSVAGFSKIGSYTGNSSTSGPTITTDFEPAFVMIKRTSSTGNWQMLDNKRSPSNPRRAFLLANATQTEVSSSLSDVDFNSNGFQIKTDWDEYNQSGNNYIYMAFANQF